MVARVGETVGTSATWPISRMIERTHMRPRIAVAIGRNIAVAVPKAKSRMITAAPIPTNSLLWVLGLETALPR